jgi:hypothetical protein
VKETGFATVLPDFFVISPNNSGNTPSMPSFVGVRRAF